MRNRYCDGRVAKFYNIVNDLIERFVSLKTSSNSDIPSWFSKKLMAVIKDKINAFKLCEKESNYIEFKQLRALCVR